MRVVAAVSAQPFLYEGQELRLGASVGVAVAGIEGDDPSALMRNADLALYAAKAGGRGV